MNRIARIACALLVVTSALLAANLLRPRSASPAVADALSLIETRAEAQNPSQFASGQNLVNAVGGQRVAGLVSVTALGDGRSFIVANGNGFQVYQVQGNGLPQVITVQSAAAAATR